MDRASRLSECVSRYQDDVEGYYACLRRSDDRGLHWDDSVGGWCATSYEICTRLLDSGRLTRAPVALPRDGPLEHIELAERILNEQLMFAGPLGGMARREYWTSFLAGRLLANGDATLYRLAIETIDATPADSVFDTYMEMLQPFSSRVICAAFGISEELRQQLYPSITSYVRLFDGKLTSSLDYQTAVRSVVDLHEELKSQFERCPHPPDYPRSNWLSDLLLCLVAGHESVAYALSTVIRHYDAPPTARMRARALREALRFDSPIQLLARNAPTDMEEGGQSIKAGAKIYLHVGAANRDPRAFQEPSRFLVDRTGPTSLAFGSGNTRCLGRGIAWRASLVFLRALSDRAEWFRDEAAVGAHGIAGRGLARLPAARIKSTTRRRGSPG